MKSWQLLTLLTLALVLTGGAATSVSAAEHRAFWVDAWGSGFESESATTTMLNYVDSCNANVVIVEVRKRADAYYSSSYEPTGWNITPDQGYDCLADLVSEGHARGLEVHAWVVVYRVWTSTSSPPSTTPTHVYTAHPEWFSYTDTGSKFSGTNSYLDPGHPEVEDYLTDVFMEIIEDYNIDGFALDYIRYPGTAWGYNSTAVARYNEEYGLSGQPSKYSTQWSNWRRDQLTNMVKRIYLEAKAVKPSIKMGAAVWKTASSGDSGYFQDWDLWMEEHWLDYASPMNYTTTNSTFNSQCDDSYYRQYGHHIYIAQGSYMNTISNSMTQISYVQNRGFPGVQCYSYRVTNSGTVNRTAFKNSLLSGPFSSSASIPSMSWISNPSKGMLKGLVKNQSGQEVYPATVTVEGAGVSTKNSGTGFYGFVDLSPNTYTVTASASGYDDAEGQITITAGQVKTLNLTLGTGGGGGEDIIIDNPACEFYGSWSTGTSSSDKYGSNYRYAGTAYSTTRWAKWRPNITTAGDYDVYCWYPQGSNRSSRAPYTVYWDGGSQTIEVNQQTNGGQWNLLVSEKSFETGTSQYVRLTNHTHESSKVVMCDAVKFAYAGGGEPDTEPPTVPQNLDADAVSSTRIDLTWSASTDNVGVEGYKIYRNGSQIDTSSTTSYPDTSCSPDTTYTYEVSAYDAAQNESGKSSPAVETTPPGAVEDIIIDNSDSEFSCSGNWSTGSYGTPWGSNYRWRLVEATSDPATWTPDITASGSWSVYAWWVAGTNRSNSAPFVVYYSGGSTTIYKNQQTSGSQWNLLTTKTFGTGTGYPTQLSCWTSAGDVVIADAIKWVKQ